MHIQTTSAPTEAAAEQIANALVQHQEQPVLLLLAGGSALDVVEHIPTSILGKNLTIMMGDDRFTADSEHNNFRQLQQTNFYQEALTRGVRCIETVPDTKNTTPEAYALSINKTLSYYLDLSADIYVIGLFGIGPDGHTASIFPTTKAKDFRVSYMSDVLYTASKNPGGPISDRVTLTPYLIKHHLDEAIVYATGENKRSILEALTDDSIAVHQVPAKLLTRVATATLYTDQTL